MELSVWSGVGWRVVWRLCVVFGARRNPFSKAYEKNGPSTSRAMLKLLPGDHAGNQGGGANERQGRQGGSDWVLSGVLQSHHLT